MDPAGLLCPWNSPGKSKEWVANPFSRWPQHLAGSQQWSPRVACKVLAHRSQKRVSRGRCGAERKQVDNGHPWEGQVPSPGGSYRVPSSNFLLQSSLGQQNEQVWACPLPRGTTNDENQRCSTLPSWTDEWITKKKEKKKRPKDAKLNLNKSREQKCKPVAVTWGGSWWMDTRAPDPGEWTGKLT